MHQVLVMREIKYLLFFFFFSYFLPHLLSLRGIFRLLAQYQLENKDNPSYPGTYRLFPHLFVWSGAVVLQAQSQWHWLWICRLHYQQQKSCNCWFCES